LPTCSVVIAAALVDIASLNNMVAASGSESVVSLLLLILDEEVLVVVVLESEFPSVTDLKATSFLDLVLEGTKSIEFGFWCSDYEE
jgi:hypothetical protein